MEYFKHHVKFDNLNHSIDLDKDKEDVLANRHQEQIRLQLEKDKLKNKHFDPEYMESTLPEIGTSIQNNMFDPGYITENK